MFNSDNTLKIEGDPIGAFVVYLHNLSDKVDTLDSNQLESERLKFHAFFSKAPEILLVPKCKDQILSLQGRLFPNPDEPTAKMVDQLIRLGTESNLSIVFGAFNEQSHLAYEIEGAEWDNFRTVASRINKHLHICAKKINGSLTISTDRDIKAIFDHANSFYDLFKIVSPCFRDGALYGIPLELHHSTNYPLATFRDRYSVLTKDPFGNSYHFSYPINKQLTNTPSVGNYSEEFNKHSHLFTFCRMLEVYGLSNSIPLSGLGVKKYMETSNMATKFPEDIASSLSELLKPREYFVFQTQGNRFVAMAKTVEYSYNHIEQKSYNNVVLKTFHFDVNLNGKIQVDNDQIYYSVDDFDNMLFRGCKRVPKLEAQERFNRFRAENSSKTIPQSEQGMEKFSQLTDVSVSVPGEIVNLLTTKLRPEEFFIRKEKDNHFIIQGRKYDKNSKGTDSLVLKVSFFILDDGTYEVYGGKKFSSLDDILAEYECSRLFLINQDDMNNRMSALKEDVGSFTKVAQNVDFERFVEGIKDSKRGNQLFRMIDLLRENLSEKECREKSIATKKRTCRVSNLPSNRSTITVFEKGHKSRYMFHDGELVKLDIANVKRIEGELWVTYNETNKKVDDLDVNDSLEKEIGEELRCSKQLNPNADFYQLFYLPSNPKALDLSVPFYKDESKPSASSGSKTVCYYGQ